MLSIIIVNYRSSLLIADSIRTLKEFNPGLEKEIIVVDNASGDPHLDDLKKAHPDMILVTMPENAGFARANNAGMRVAKGRQILLLNPDTLSVDDSITSCFQLLERSEFIAAGVQQLNADGTPQISGNYFVKGGLNHLLPIPYWGDFIRWLAYQAKTRVPNVAVANSQEEVDWISGAFLMVKRSAIEAAGMMDEDFFLYAEEVEWCSRLRKVGRLCIFGDLRIVHLEGATINKATEAPEKGYYNLYDRKGLQLMVSNHLRVRKQYGVMWFLILLLNYTWGMLLFYPAGFFHRLVTFRNPFGHFSKAWAFTKNLAQLWLRTPLIVSGRPHFYKMFP